MLQLEIRILTVIDKVLKQPSHRRSRTQSWFENPSWCIYECHYDMDAWQSQRLEIPFQPFLLVPPTASYHSVDVYVGFSMGLRCIFPNSPDWSNFISTSWIKSKIIFIQEMHQPFFHVWTAISKGLSSSSQCGSENLSKTNFRNTLERFHWKEGLSFRCYTVSTARFQ